jgi:hypothetical protein
MAGLRERRRWRDGGRQRRVAPRRCRSQSSLHRYIVNVAASNFGVVHAERLEDVGTNGVLADQVLAGLGCCLSPCRAGRGLGALRGDRRDSGESGAPSLETMR